MPDLIHLALSLAGTALAALVSACYRRAMARRNAVG